MLQQVARYYHTLRYLKPVQVFGRLYPKIKKHAGLRGLVLTRVPEPPAGLQGRLNVAVPFCPHEPWNTREGILEGRFRFIRHEETLGRPVRRWDVPHLPILWRYNLHYFHYLFLLDPPEQEALCLEWVRGNPVGQTVGWYPYPTSLRIVNWCKAGLQHPVLVESLYRQAAYLYRNMEVYLPANHWLENAKALVFAAIYLSGRGEAKQWMQEGLRILRQETNRHVLPDGGHFERSPMYHAIMLEGYLDLINILPPDHPDRALFADAARRMADFLLSVTHPDGNIALFNDATQEIAPPTGALVDYVERLLAYRPVRKEAFPETGYFVYDRPGIYFVIDAGPVGPDFMPAHAHADVFSFELSLNGHPFVVDSGTYDYVSGPCRDALRGTAAHNTVCVDGVDQVECWGSFRVARRFAPTDVSWTCEAGARHFEGVYDGYGHLIGDGIRHRRRVVCDATRRFLRVEDTVEGRATHRIESFLHVHPDVSVRPEGQRASLSRDGTTCSLEASGARLQVRDGWYCPEFGLRRPAKMLVLVAEDAALPISFSYTIQY